MNLPQIYRAMEGISSWRDASDVKRVAFVYEMRGAFFSAPEVQHAPTTADAWHMFSVGWDAGSRHTQTVINGPAPKTA